MNLLYTEEEFDNGMRHVLRWHDGEPSTLRLACMEAAYASTESVDAEDQLREALVQSFEIPAAPSGEWIPCPKKPGHWFDTNTNGFNDGDQS